MRLTLALTALLGCSPQVEPDPLLPYTDPYGPQDPGWAAQPHRDHPQEVVVSGERAWVSLPGSEDEPGHELASVELATGEVRRLDIRGSSPTGLAVHPGGEVLVSFNRFDSFVSVVDAVRGRVSGRLPADYYATEGAFTPDGDELWITNRWRDAVSIWTVDAIGGRLEVLDREEPGISVGTNPRDLVISDDGSRVAVASPTGMTVSLIDRAARTEIARIELGAPANDVAFAGPYLFVATTSASTHHLPLSGPDTDGDGQPGDGTPNVNFQDLQNEIAVYRASDGTAAHRYTSDTLCCRDYRDTHPDDLELAGDLLPPEDQWIVGGALPEQLAVSTIDGATWLYVTYSASNELQRFGIDLQTGALTPDTPWKTPGHNPHGIAVQSDSVWVVHRLSETLSRLDARSGEVENTWTVGDVSGGAFPATDAEIGELFNFVTAPFTVDGDQSCAHCHREGSNIDKAFSMPLTLYGGLGRRMTMAYRGAADTRPWFFESAFDEGNFKPVMNEFARIENFCCTDYTLFPDGAPPDCAAHPPPECTTEGNAGSRNGFVAERPALFDRPRPTGEVTRDAFYLARSEEVVGRTTSFGDSVFLEDPITGTRSPRPLDFEGITRSLGAFLLHGPKLLPNPNPPDSESALRGRALFESAETACSVCHPAPTFAASTDHNPSNVPLRMGPVVSPTRSESGVNLDLLARGFLETFPRSEMDTCEEVCGAEDCEEDPAVCDDLRSVYLGVPSLRGLWDRADSMLHDGRAQGLLEVLCTPGHPALGPGQTGFNERDGVIDTHGGTSHLSADEVADLIAYVLSL